MTNEVKKAKLQELRAVLDYLNICINKAENSEDNDNEIVAISEILLTKVYALYPDIVRVFG